MLGCAEVDDFPQNLAILSSQRPDYHSYYHTLLLKCSQIRVTIPLRRCVVKSVRKLMLTVMYYPHAAQLATVALALFGLVFYPTMGPSAGGGGV